MYGMGYAQLPLRNAGVPTTDGAILVIDDGVGATVGPHRMGPSLHQLPRRINLPASSAVPTSDGPVVIPTPIIPAVPVVVSSNGVLVNPISQPVSDSGSTSWMGVPWWVFAGVGGVLLLGFSGGSTRGRRG